MNRRIFESLYRIGATIRERRQRTRTIAELSRLSDRELTDIGISRSEIPLIAAHGRRI